MLSFTTSSSSDSSSISDKSSSKALTLGSSFSFCSSTYLFCRNHGNTQTKHCTACIIYCTYNIRTYVNTHRDTKLMRTYVYCTYCPRCTSRLLTTVHVQNVCALFFCQTHNYCIQAMDYCLKRCPLSKDEEGKNSKTKRAEKSLPTAFRFCFKLLQTCAIALPLISMKRPINELQHSLNETKHVLNHSKKTHTCTVCVAMQKWLGLQTTCTNEHT